MKFVLIVGGDEEESFEYSADAINAARSRALGLAARSGRPERVEVRGLASGRTIGVATAELTCKWAST